MTQSTNVRPAREVAVITCNPNVGRAIAEALRQGGDQQFHLTTEGLRAQPASAPLPELAILDVDLADGGEREKLERILSAYGERVAFVVTSPTPTVEGLRTLLRHGIVDLLPQPLVAEEVLRAVSLALEALRRRSPERPPAGTPTPRGAVAAILRAGGGVGGTAIATQAACALAKGPLTNSPVCLLDFDVQFGSAAFHLSLPQRTNLLDLAAAGDRLDGAMLKTTMARHADGLDVLAAPPGIQPLDSLTPELVAALLAEARRHYALAIIDLPLAWTAWTRATLAESDRILLVVSPDMASLRHAKRQIETLHEEGLDHVPLSIVANRVQRGLFGNGPSTKDMETALGRPIDHLIPADPHFQEAANQGKTLAELGAGRIAKRLTALFDGLVPAAPASA